MKKIYIASIVFAALSIACYAAYHAHGVSEDADGFVQEAFGFIPLGYLFAALSALCGIVGLIQKYLNRGK